MTQKATLLIAFFLLAGLSFAYWGDQAFWLVPWSPIFYDMLLLVYLFSSWKNESQKQTDPKLAVLSGFVKWTLWIVLTGYLYISAFFIFGLGIIKYPCPALHLKLAKHPLTELAIEISFVLCFWNVVLMIMNLVHGKRFGSWIRRVIVPRSNQLVKSPILVITFFACMIGAKCIADILLAHIL